MYELLILAALMSRNMSGYKLRMILENAMSPRRKISNGVLYPVLDKLKIKGYICFDEDQDSRGTKTAYITESGRDYFHELMEKPVIHDSKWDDMYRFKMRGMNYMSVVDQVAILRDYHGELDEDFHVYTAVKKHLEDLREAHPTTEDYYQWQIRTTDFVMTVLETKMNWIQTQIKEIQKLENKK
ncbi:transcriptional regulator [Dellaglioa algida]|uniref:PadR family transcriptional regulator n=1 Tax=Dellaglioa carnosa TaxID=2995136 RepID=A0ABT4JMF0_9LACO|nr:PadR family transcriptional regulator [Dellaglioa carnosa]TWW13313.1 transcriptional regulator [Dellaglioa algida]MCZ2491280.1 PadR family transcriptional regulator [Dellaglioa carnosa]MCZ2492819.1 PadR family transcriptional regulator [Dellaglioa carnosa]MCZ2494358.1 PadR family transcriptional regulator [Dellaglioa carnosa]MDK1731226.1 PadR family transcriptional regulator [Dellaglioa carnosa]